MSDWYEELKNAPKGSPEHNEYLCMEYPFLRLKNDDDFTFTWLDEIPEGWHDIVLLMCEEIKERILEQGYEFSDYVILQAKEKFGRLRWYAAAPDSYFHDIVNAYEDMSKTICAKCGEEATKFSVNWMRPFCDKCAKEIDEKMKNI